MNGCGTNHAGLGTTDPASADAHNFARDEHVNGALLALVAGSDLRTVLQSAFDAGVAFGKLAR